MESERWYHQITEIVFDTPESEKSSDCVSDKGFCDSLGQLSFWSDLSERLWQRCSWRYWHACVSAGSAIKGYVFFFLKLHIIQRSTSPAVTHHLSHSYPQSPLRNCQRQRSRHTGQPGPPLHTDCFIYFKQSVMEKDKTESVENPAPACVKLFFVLCDPPWSRSVSSSQTLSFSGSMWVNCQRRSHPLRLWCIFNCRCFKGQIYDYYWWKLCDTV